jgi:hypothetical protein
MLPFTDIFTQNQEKVLTTRKVKDLFYRKIGYELPETTFQNEFLFFRDNFTFMGKKVLHWVEYGKHVYSLSNNKYYIIKHNARLNRIKVRADKRKVQTN